MQKSISDFVAHVGSNKLASPTRYWVEFQSGSGSSMDDLVMYCKTAQMPGRSYQTVEQRQINVPFKIPYVAAYEDINFTFTLSEDLKERKFFEEWQATIYNEDSATMNYYDEYKGQCRVAQLDKEGNPTYTIMMRDAYPVALSSVDYAYDNTNQLQQMTVTMAYRYWTNMNL